MARIVGAIVGLAVLGGLGFLAFSDSAQGVLSAFFWNRTETFRCVGGAEILFEDETLDLRVPAFEALDHCRITLRNCTIKSPRPIVVRDNASLVAEGGRIEAEETAVDTDAHVTLKNVTVTSKDVGITTTGAAEVTISGGSISATTAVLAQGGKVKLESAELLGNPTAISSAGEAVVAGDAQTVFVGEIEQLEDSIAAPDGDIEGAKRRKKREEELRDRHDQWAEQGCAGFIECFKKSGLSAMVSTTIILTIDKKGRVSRTKLQGVLSEVRSCVNKAIKGRRLKRYKGSGGKVTCTLEGSVMPGSASLGQEITYLPNER